MRHRFLAGMLAFFALLILPHQEARACDCTGFLCEAQCHPALIGLKSATNDETARTYREGIVEVQYRERRRHWRRWHRHHWRHRNRNRNNQSQNQSPNQNTPAPAPAPTTGGSNNAGGSGGTPTQAPAPSTGSTSDDCFMSSTGDLICPQGGTNTGSSPTPAPSQPSNPPVTPPVVSNPEPTDPVPPVFPQQPPAPPPAPAPTPPPAYEFPTGFGCGENQMGGGYDTSIVKPPAATRDPLKQPFASNSIWNTPIGCNAVYKPANFPKVPGGDQWAPMPQIDDEHIVLTPDAPMTTVNYSSVGWNGGNRCNATGGSAQGLPFSVPMPRDYIRPNSGDNSSAVFLMPDKRTLIHMQPLARCSAGSSATALVKFNPVDIYGDGITGSHGGSGMSAIGGSIRVGELRPNSGAPRHALKVNVYAREIFYRCGSRNDCFRWPATTADSYAVGHYGSNRDNPSYMKMGALLAIPRNTDIESLGLESTPGKMLAWTLQNYGAYIVDDTWGPAFAINAEDGPAGSMHTQFKADWGYNFQARVNENTPWSRDVQRLMQALHVVDNNGPNSIGGGGAPLQPLAPPTNP